ncbi:flagellar hook assembly protein FlgD [Ideonella livida]|uniref:Basal-body rod modification protein FlgD n=1 Tax=Ideonella livida TaxID=2707176 RepID=A0A7C9TGQ7_9BURK|nr:flagellar hook capping FlgD N-terminal domain-containing protein [Ideonella livida]NDY89959.1 flagellar hook assembly protein FlgD [Ideonella livida]
MTTTSVLSSTSTSTRSSSSTSALGGTTAQEASDRFLKLLVTQMQNQDPLNPTDNAQITSQMAQISTVSGIENLNTTVGGLNTQFLQLQALQGASLVGREVALASDALRQSGGKADAGFELAAAADKVTVDIYDAGNVKIGTLNLGAQAAGRHDFEWTVPSAYQDDSLHFTVTATAAGKELSTNTLSYQKVNAVSQQNGTLALELANGSLISSSDVYAYL